MADLYAVAATVTNAGADAALIGGNARKVTVFYPNASETAGNPTTQLGTRQLVTLKATAGGGTPFAAADLADANSAYHKSIVALQNYGELFYVARISDTVIGFIYAVDTANGSEVATPNLDADTYGNLEAELNTATGQTCTVAAAALA